MENSEAQELRILAWLSPAGLAGYTYARDLEVQFGMPHAELRSHLCYLADRRPAVVISPLYDYWRITEAGMERLPQLTDAIIRELREARNAQQVDEPELSSTEKATLQAISQLFLPTAGEIGRRIHVNVTDALDLCVKLLDAGLVKKRTVDEGLGIIGWVLTDTGRELEERHRFQ